MDNWLENYINVLEKLDRNNLQSLETVTADTLEFRDPFNHTHSQQAFLAIMADMFEKLPTVRFTIHQSMQDDLSAFIRWTFTANSKMTGEFSVEGTSRLEADSQGLITLHHDYWDASELMQRLPVLGCVIGKLRRKLSH